MIKTIKERLVKLKQVPLESFMEPLGYTQYLKKSTKRNPVWIKDDHKIVFLFAKSKSGFFEYTYSLRGGTHSCYDLAIHELGVGVSMREVVEYLEEILGKPNIAEIEKIIKKPLPPIPSYPPPKEQERLALEAWKSVPYVTPKDCYLVKQRHINVNTVSLYGSLKSDWERFYVLTRLHGRYCSMFTYKWAQKGLPKGLGLLAPKGDSQPKSFIVCESIVDGLAYYDLHKDSFKTPPYIAATCGYPSSEQLEYLRNIARDYLKHLWILAFDNDEAGHKLKAIIKKVVLSNEHKVKVHFPPEELKDWAEGL